MNELSPSELTERIVEKAKSLGASAVGVARVDSLKVSPSHRISPKIGMGLEVRWRDAPDDVVPAEVDWPADAVSAVVIGVSHPADQPELDWYDGKGTPGNRALIRIVKELSDWLKDSYLHHHLPAALLHREWRGLHEGRRRAGWPGDCRQEQPGHHA